MGWRLDAQPLEKVSSRPLGRAQAQPWPGWSLARWSWKKKQDDRTNENVTRSSRARPGRLSSFPLSLPFFFLSSSFSPFFFTSSLDFFLSSFEVSILPFFLSSFLCPTLFSLSLSFFPPASPPFISSFSPFLLSSFLRSVSLTWGVRWEESG